MVRCISLLVLVFLAAACTPDPPEPAAAPPPDSVDAPEAPQAPSVPADPAWTVTDTGAGPLRFGMALAEVEQALDGRFTREGLPQEETCYYVRPEAAPEGVQFMMVDGKLARVDVFRDAPVRTQDGVGIGATEARVREVYGAAVETEPHHYTEGHYLVIERSAADSTFLVFETDGMRVTEYRAGRLPAVRWVEGCS